MFHPAWVMGSPGFLLRFWGFIVFVKGRLDGFHDFGHLVIFLTSFFFLMFGLTKGRFYFF